MNLRAHNMLKNLILEWNQRSNRKVLIVVPNLNQNKSAACWMVQPELLCQYAGSGINRAKTELAVKIGLNWQFNILNFFPDFIFTAR